MTKTVISATEPNKKTIFHLMMEEQIENSKNGKAAGFDGVPNDILKLAKNVLSALLTNLFNTMFDISYFPAA